MMEFSAYCFECFLINCQESYFCSKLMMQIFMNEQKTWKILKYWFKLCNLTSKLNWKLLNFIEGSTSIVFMLFFFSFYFLWCYFMLFTRNCYQKDVELVDRFHEKQEAELEEVFSRMCCDLYIACDELTVLGTI